MRGVFAIARRELQTYFASPSAYVVAAGMLALFGYLFSGFLFVSKQATLRPLSGQVMIVLLFVAPLLSMRLLADEFRSGTIELLLTSPIRDWQVVVGKFMASLALFVMMVVPTLYYVVVLKVFGDPDLGAVLTLYLGLLLLGGALLSLGTFASSLSSNPILAGVLGVGIVLFLWLLPALAPFVDEPVKGMIRYAGLSSHFGDFTKGVVDTKDVVFYAGVMASGLFLATRVLEIRRGRR